MAKVERLKEPKKVLNGFTDDGVIAMMNAFTTKTFLELGNNYDVSRWWTSSIEIRTLNKKLS
ncbi:hypothetical protein [Heyndrickxia oleronia]|uniref:Uncharacterized protein n=1 Tax=Heyndrickxia oleronia TaxID=38875 RepID=A0AAW6SZV6_9BACI|nr:hypothetical protein [Heyndrickxia oleronia]MDH5162597.1 hypothetical protein [Heyndrickxia oleronia]